MAAGATVWLDDLPAIVASLERDWAITAGQTLSGGTEGGYRLIDPEGAIGDSRRAACCWPRPTRWPGKPGRA